MKLSKEINEEYEKMLGLLPKSEPVPQRVIVFNENPRCRAKVRWDDQCKNGHNTFAITGTEYRVDLRGNRVRELSAGCIHDEISVTYPQLRHMIKWHLMSSYGPMHYLHNVLFFAGNRDCWGHAPGDGINHAYHIELPDGTFLRGPDQSFLRTGLRVMHFGENLKGAEFVAKSVGGEVVKLPRNRSKGKRRELKAARSAAVWPDATDEVLCLEPELLARVLISRLPNLMDQFKRDIEGIGFNY